MKGVTDLLPPGAVLSTSPMRGDPPPLLGPEESLAAAARGRRRREVAWGRACAREALRALGYGPEPVPVGADADGVPTWPPGAVGSISHCARLCAAVAAPTTAVRAIGIDVEETGLLSAPQVALLSTPRERDALDGEGPEGKVLFSAKESAYKCLSPGIPFLEWCPTCSVLLAADGRFTVESVALEPTGIVGRYAVDDGLIVTAAWTVAP